MRYLKKILLFTLFIFLAFNWPHAAVAMKRWDTRLLNVASHNFHSFLKIKWYLKKGANINAQDEEGQTALHFAILYLRWDIAEFLLKESADPNMQDNLGYTPLMWVVRSSEYMSFTGDDPFFKVSKYGDRYRDKIASRYHQPRRLEATPYLCMKVMQLLLKYGADLNIKTRHSDKMVHSFSICLKKTALMYAENNRWLVEFLLKNGADLNIQDIRGQTVLMAATPEIIKVLCKAGAKPNIQDRSDFTALHLVAFCNDIERMQRLIEYGADYTLKDHKGRTPFDICKCVKGKRSIGQRRDKLTFNTLARAIKHDTIKDFRLKHYILHGVDLEFRCIDRNNTLLDYAAFYNKEGAIRLLLGYGAQAAPKDNEGATPLHQAAYRGNKSAIKVLLKAPQGSPRYQSKDVVSEEQIITFFLCLKRLFDGKGDERFKKIKFPCQTRRNLFLPYLVPKIDKVPLLQLRQYVKFIGKNSKEELANALTERHVDQVANILSSVDKLEMTPLGRAQVAGHGQGIRNLLRHDRKSLEGEYGKQIKDNYLALL